MKINYGRQGEDRSPIQKVLNALDRLNKTYKLTGDNKWKAQCPAHKDSTPSLSIGVGDDGRVLLHCFNDCKSSDICAAIGLKESDLFVRNGRASKQAPKQQIVAVYDYRDESGALLYQSVRYEKKGFAQRRADGTWSMNGVRRVLYRLPELIKANPDDWVFVCEGEKDVDNLVGFGSTVTCNIGGAGKWIAEYSEYLRGRKVCIFPDNDKPGRQHAQEIAQSLCGIASVVKIVNLPGLIEKGDVSDFIDAQREECDVGDLLIGYAEEAIERQPSDSDDADQQQQPVEVYKPFPTHVLPEPVRGFIIKGSKAIGCDPSFIALPLLSALASAIGNTMQIELKRGWVEPAIVWTAIVGESGTMKSPAIELALRAVKKRQQEAMKQYRLEMEAYEAELEQDGKNKRSSLESAKRLKQPIADRCWCDDTTVEALAALLQNQPRGLLMVRDELSGWFGGFGRYSGGKGSDVAQWLEVYGGRSMLIDRKTGNSRTISIDRAAVSVTGGIQPRTLRRAMGEEYRENGLLARLLFCYPPSKSKRWTESDISPEAEAVIADIFARLYELRPDLDSADELYPHTLMLSTEGKKAWIQYYDEHAKEQVELTGDLSAAWSKLEGYTARLALVVHCIRMAANDPTLVNMDAVDEISISAGVTLSQWFGCEAQRLYNILSESDDERTHRQLIELIQNKGGSVTVRELQRSSKRFETAQSAELALKGLVAAGNGKWEHPDPSPKGGRAVSVFHLLTPSTVDTTLLKPVEYQGCVNVDDDEKNEWGVI